jgi:hypothetical protein
LNYEYLIFDTLFAIKDTGYFYIVEDSTSLLYTENAYYNSWARIKRYHSSFEKDTLEFQPATCLKDVGLIKYYLDFMAITYYWYSEYLLIDYNLVSE